MTTMAMTEPRLRRLFERLDFAPLPKQEPLRLILKRWEAARGGAPAPRRQSIVFPKTGAAAAAMFVCRSVEGEHDWVLAEGGQAIEALLGPCTAGDRLSQAKNRREAVRLRRLFDEVRRVGEAVLAEFAIAEPGHPRAAVELLAAPLSEDGKTIDSVLGAASISAFKTAAHGLRPSTSMNNGFVLFALGGSRPFGEQAARLLGADLAPHEDREFEDGEHKTRPLVSVRNRDVYVIFSLHGEQGQSGADKLCRLLFFIGALGDAGAARITAVVPYLCYARKDRQTKPRDPVVTRYVAQMFEAVGTNCVMALDVHNVAAFQNAFRCQTESLDAQAVFVRHFVGALGGAPVAVVSPDLGGEKRAELFRQRLERALARPVAKGFMEKHRSMGQVSGEIFAGDVVGRTVIVLDDLISAGGTMARAAAACRKAGAARVWLAATHGVFSSRAAAVLGEAPVDRIVVTDAVPLPTGMKLADFKGRLNFVSVAGLIAEAIRRRHTGGSITELLEEGP
ncbi:MAG: ribose-phosphate diphosphokinase [Methylocystis sp.]|nr:ribose-phosphate diphosphokinase [Methylocystis sp.]